MSWEPPLEENCDVPITGYVIQYARVEKDFDNMIVNIPNDTKFITAGLDPNTEYKITVAAVNANGTGPFSDYVFAISGEDSELNYIHRLIYYVHSYLTFRMNAL